MTTLLRKVIKNYWKTVKSSIFPNIPAVRVRCQWMNITIACDVKYSLSQAAKVTNILSYLVHHQFDANCVAQHNFQEKLQATVQQANVTKNDLGKSQQ